MKSFTKFALVLTALAVAAPAGAQRNWIFLGQREVNDQAERDVIRVEGARRFSQIRLCVANHAVQFYDVDVRFRNGGNQDIRLRTIIGADSCSGAINLRGGAGRDIDQVVFAYEARTLGRRGARVRLYGR
jgi:hypothetical protein